MGAAGGDDGENGFEVEASPPYGAPLRPLGSLPDASNNPANALIIERVMSRASLAVDGNEPVEPARLVGLRAGKREKEVGDGGSVRQAQSARPASASVRVQSSIEPVHGGRV